MPSLEQTYQQPEIHSEWASIYRSPGLVAFNRTVMQRVLRTVTLPRGSEVLDAGCGTGVHSEAFVQAGFRCTGIDISEFALDVARKRVAGAAFKRAALETLPFAAESFDLVHCRGVLMHIPDWETALAELCRVVKVGGKLVILDNNSSGIEMALIKLVRKFRHGESKMTITRGGMEFWAEKKGHPFVVRYFFRDALVQEIEKNDVAVEYIFAFELFDLARFPTRLRALVNKINLLWLRMRMPARLSHGIAIIGTKRVA